jgi:hypothetical protein
VRARLSPNALVGLSGGIFAAALALVILVHATIVVVIVLIPAGMAWVGVTATVSTLLQLFLPRWVRARGLSVYQMVLFGAQGLGALAWGVIAESVGLTVTFLVAAGLMAGAAASIRIWPFVDTSGMGRDIVVRPAPTLELEPDDDSGPVIVSTSYSITTEDEPEFMQAMARVRESRLRTGATQWGLFRDGQKPNRFEEVFVVASWEEHLRQHRERLTATDLSYEDQAKRLSKTVPQSRHLLPTDLDKK